MQVKMKRVNALMLSGLLAATLASAQNTPPPEAPPAAANPARDLLQSKCLQCHNDGIWRDQRQDARAWEATLYRMMGRGAVWSGEDIKTMASYLATDFGPNSPRAQRPNR
jgi:mono/diheme cytochrome c family protein